MSTQEVELQALRRGTALNNLAWLRAFGCKIEDTGGIVRVSHAALPEYRAWLLYPDFDIAGSQQSSPSAFAHEIGVSSKPDLYIDDEWPRGQLTESLSSAGYVPFSSSATLVWNINGIWPHAAGWRLALAPLLDIPKWSAFYSECFGRTEIAALDRERWLQAAESEDVKFWFLYREERLIGVCQTVSAHGVVGVYSACIVPTLRTAQTLRTVLWLLSQTPSMRSGQPTYLERVANPRARARQKMGEKVGRLRLVRRSVGYRCRA